MPLGAKPKKPSIVSLPPEKQVPDVTAEAEMARREMEERMRRAGMSRAKSKLTPPSLVKRATQGPRLMEALG